MNLVKAVVPGMVERKYGKIINFSSIVAKIGIAIGSYSASKAAVSAFYQRGGNTIWSIQYKLQWPSLPGIVKTNFYAGIGGIADQIFNEMAGWRR